MEPMLPGGGVPAQQVPPDLQAVLDQYGLTLDDLAAMFEGGVYPERSAMLGDQMASAQQLQQAPMPQGRQAGAVYQAAHPLEIAATTMGRIQGQRQMGDLRKQQQSMIDMLRQGNRAGGLAAMRERLGVERPIPEAVPALYDAQAEDWETVPYYLRRPDWQR